MIDAQRLLFNLRGHNAGKGHIVRRRSQVHSPAVGDSNPEETHRLSVVLTETPALTRVSSEESVPLYPLLFALSNPGYDVAISLSARTLLGGFKSCSPWDFSSRAGSGGSLLPLFLYGSYSHYASLDHRYSNVLGQNFRLALIMAQILCKNYL
ncbi:hypothetical protein PM082_004874 [Marasmius tenuissimus]|nr:hypothetical protein PM082_004874 [Marasmius tenuissimus]